ncbi:MAG: class I SAM-dependent methyltransferase [Luteolibacter sp.]
MNAALETLMLAFSGEEASEVPGRALFLGARPCAELKSWPEVTGWQPFRPMADAWEEAGFTRVERPEGKWPVVMVLPGKSRDETLEWFALARDHLEPGGRIVVAMPNTAGASRFEKEFARAVGGVVSISKNKCRAFHAVEDGSWNDELFAEWRALGSERDVEGYSVRAGIFSCDHIDAGSKLLADHFPAYFRGNVADLGAGWGFLSDRVLKRCPKIRKIDLYEADARALECARKNLAGHEREIGFHWHDVAAGIPEGYDTVISNPPFHTGQQTDVDLGRAFLKSAHGALKRGGNLWLVANRQLPYEAALDALGMSWRKVAEDKTFKVISADKR